MNKYMVLNLVILYRIVWYKRRIEKELFITIYIKRERNRDRVRERAGKKK